MPRTDAAKNRAYQAKWYAANRSTQAERVRKRKSELKEWFLEQKLCGCKKTGCQCNHPAAIDFHHTDPSKKKEIGLANAFHKGWSKDRILAEIAKCIPLCAVCHRVLHYELKYNGIDVTTWLATPRDY